MPLLTLSELEQASALFRGKCGNALCKGLMHMLSVDKVNPRPQIFLLSSARPYPRKFP